MKPAIFVTGGAGYIGAHCCKLISESGFIPVCYDNLSTGHRDFVKWGPRIVGDIGDTEGVKTALREFDVKAVMHLAAASQVGESVADPAKYYQNNVQGTLSLLEAMRETGCKILVFSSTAAVYGDAGGEPIREGAAGNPVNPYGRTKWMIEQILSDYRAAFDLRSICLRYFNASGADASAVIGELRDPETHLIPRAMMALQGHVADFGVFGEDYPTPDGTAIRDYIHVTDIAVAHLSAVKLLQRSHDGGAFNIGTGRGYSVKQVIDAIMVETGRSLPFMRHPRRAGDPAILVGNPASAVQALGLKASHSDLPTIVRSAWAWHQKAHPRRTAAVG